MASQRLTNTEATDTHRDCGNNNFVDWDDSTTNLWPPNHKFVAESITATSNASGNTSVAVTPVVTDAAGGDGGANHDPDYQPSPDSNDPATSNGVTAMESDGSATVNFDLRAERSGKGEGRTYTLNWSASFTDGSSCSSDGSDANHQPFTASVPHDMGHRS